MPVVTIDEQLACVERELGFRRKLYPRWVRDGKLTQAGADEELVRMDAVLLTLRRVQTMQDHHVPNAEDIRRGAEARVLTALAPMVHSSVYLKVQRRLAEVRS
jgi:hypothetical protein